MYKHCSLNHCPFCWFNKKLIAFLKAWIRLIEER